MRYTLSDRGIKYITRRDRAQLSATMAAEVRPESASALQWSVPTARSDRAFNRDEDAIAPDAVGHLLAGGMHVPFYFEHELRARHPRGVSARLRPYISYYRSDAPRDDQPPSRTRCSWWTPRRWWRTAPARPPGCPP